MPFRLKHFKIPALFAVLALWVGIALAGDLLWQTYRQEADSLVDGKKDYAKAETLYHAALKECSTLSDNGSASLKSRWTCEMSIQSALQSMYLKMKRFEDTQKVLSNMLATYKAHASDGLEGWEITISQALADLKLEQGNLKEAEELYRFTLELYEKKGEPTGEQASVLHALAVVYARTERMPQAEALLKKAEALRHHLATCTPSSEVDFGPFMKRMQKQIRANWHPPKSKVIALYRTVVSYNVLEDGSLEDIKIKQPSANPRYDQATLDALKYMGKLEEVPKSCFKKIPVEYTFDYDVRNRR